MTIETITTMNLIITFFILICAFVPVVLSMYIPLAVQGISETVADEHSLLESVRGVVDAAIDVQDTLDWSRVEFIPATSDRGFVRFVYMDETGKKIPLAFRIRRPNLSVSTRPVSIVQGQFVAAEPTDTTLRMMLDRLVFKLFDKAGVVGVIQHMFVGGTPFAEPDVYSTKYGDFIRGYMSTMEGLVASSIVDLVAIPKCDPKSMMCLLQIVIAIVE